MTKCLWLNNLLGSLVRFIAKHDLNDYNDYFCWKVGGDGETLMYQLDTFFEMLDIKNNESNL